VHEETKKQDKKQETRSKKYIVNVNEPIKTYVLMYKSMMYISITLPYLTSHFYNECLD